MRVRIEKFRTALGDWYRLRSVSDSHIPASDFLSEKDARYFAEGEGWEVVQ